MAKKLIIWDFDGVIVNTTKIGHAMHAPHYPDMTMEEYLDIFTENANLGFEAFESRRVETDFDSSAYYIEKLLELEADMHMHNIVASLAKHYHMGIVTSSRGSGVRTYLRKHNLEQYFDFVFGQELGFSKAEKIKKALADSKVEASDAIFITDTLGDIKEANHCGVKSIGVTWGFHEKERLSKGRPDAIVETPEDLEAVVRGMLK